MIGHLGSRVSALLDGQLSPEEMERAWAHVHSCHGCRDLVEREGWVKTRLAGLSFAGASAPDHLKGSLRGGSTLSAPADVFLEEHHPGGGRRAAGLVAMGGSAVGAAVMGVLVLGVGPAQAPTMDQRVPVSHLTAPTAPTAPTARLASPSPAPAHDSRSARPVSGPASGPARRAAH